MQIGGTMKVSTFAAIAVLAVLAAGCGGKERAGEGVQGQGSAAISAEPGDVAAQPIAYQTGGGGTTGALPGITVMGTGTARAVPDVADWSFGVQADAETASAALEEASAATRRIIDALRDAGIVQEDLRTEQVSLYPRTTNDGRAVIGYTASSSVHAIVRDLDQAGAVVDAAVEAGANQVYGPSLSRSDENELYRDALRAGVADARAKAQVIADAAGVTLGKVVGVQEASASQPMPAAEDARASATPIVPGTQEIQASVVVTFAVV
jgi:uncharacterized protein YggE